MTVKLQCKYESEEWYRAPTMGQKMCVSVHSPEAGHSNNTQPFHSIDIA